MDKLKVCKCRSCGAPIVWITTKNGKAMPCDAKPRNYLAGSKDVLITEDGETVRGTLPEPGMMQPQGYAGWGYVPHWATCPHADEHRKAKPAQANSGCIEVGPVQTDALKRLMPSKEFMRQLKDGTLTVAELLKETMRDGGTETEVTFGFDDVEIDCRFTVKEIRKRG